MGNCQWRPDKNRDAIVTKSDYIGIYNILEYSLFVNIAVESSNKNLLLGMSVTYEDFSVSIIL